MAAPEFTVAGAMTLRGDRVVISDDAFGGRQLRLVAAMLLMDRSRPVTVDRIVEQVWPQGPPAQFMPALRGLVSKVRRFLVDVGVEGDRIDGRLGRYSIDLPELHVDIEDAAASLAQSRALLDAGQHGPASRHASAARQVLSRPILSGVESDWVESMRDMTGGQLVDALLVLGACRRDVGQFDGARSVAREAMELAPLREDGWRLAMLVEHDAGNDARALHLFGQLRGLLAEELGADPSTATQQVHGRVLRGSPAGEAASSPLLDGPVPTGPHDGEPFIGNPYVGLRSFDAGDAELFFGREAAVQGLLARLARFRAVAVVGPSGVGKSSLVKAGLLPALVRGGITDSDLWRTVVVTPGREPVRALAELAAGSPTAGRQDVDPDELAVSLSADPRRLIELVGADGASDGTTTLLVVDQAEELFTIADDMSADVFIEAVLACAGSPRSGLELVMTLRSDFYERASRHPSLAEFLSRSQFVVAPLGGDGLQLAVSGPARAAGVQVEEGVLGRLVAEAGSGDNALPLLQHALWELCQRGNGVLTSAALDDLGGVAGALRGHAETVWDTLDTRQRRIARALLLRGIALSTGQVTAVPVPRADLDGLGSTEEIDSAVAVLVDARLVTGSRQHATGRSVLQLSHEALIDAWPRLRGWVDAQRTHLQVARRLATAAEQWASQYRDDDWLLAGRRLDDVLDLVAAIESGKVDLVLSRVESALLAASEGARADRHRQAREQEAHQRALEDQAVRGLKIGLALSAAENALAQDPERTLLLCLAIADEIVDQTPQHEGTWLRLIHHALANQLLLSRHPDPGPLLAGLPDGSLVTGGSSPSRPAGSDHSGDIEIRNSHTGDVVDRLPERDLAQPVQVDVARDGATMAIGTSNGQIHVLEVGTWRSVKVVEGPDCPVGSIALSPDGHLVAALWFRDVTRELAVHDVTTGSRHYQRDPVAQPHAIQRFEPGHQLDFHPVEPRLVVSTGPGHATLQMLETDHWTVLAEHDVGCEVVWLQHSPDGRLLGVAHHYGVSIHDADTLDRLHTMRTSAKVPKGAWIRHGRELLCAGHTMRILAPEQRRPRSSVPRDPYRQVLPEWAEDRVLLTLPSGDVISGRGDTAGLQRWDVGATTGAEVARLDPTPAIAARNPPGGGVDWSPDGTQLVSVEGGSITVWQVESWERRLMVDVTDQPIPGQEDASIENVTWAPDGADIAVSGSGGILEIIDAHTGETKFTRQRPSASFQGDTDISQDGRWIVATHGPLIEILDRDGNLHAAFESPNGSSVEAAAFSPDSRWLATTHWPTGTDTPGAQGATVWDWQEHQIVGHLPGIAGNLSWTPGATTLAVSLSSRTTIWDVASDTTVHDLVGHSGWVQDVTHSPDGQVIATAGWDGDLRLWDTATGDQSLHLTGHPFIHRVRFHPQRPWLALATMPGLVHIWTLDTDELLDIARRRVTRELRPKERVLLHDNN